MFNVTKKTILTFDVCLIRMSKRNKNNTREVRAQIKSGISIKVSIVTKVFSNLKGAVMLL